LAFATDTHPIGFRDTTIWASIAAPHGGAGRSRWQKSRRASMHV